MSEADGNAGQSAAQDEQNSNTAAAGSAANAPQNEQAQGDTGSEARNEPATQSGNLTEQSVQGTSHVRQQNMLLSEVHSGMQDGVLNKIKELAEHTYLTLDEEIDALAEEVDRLAKEAGYEISKLAAKAMAVTSLLLHRIENNGHVAVTAPPDAETAAQG